MADSDAHLAGMTSFTEDEGAPMNLEVLLVGGILAAAVVLFVTEKVRVDLVALMVMLGLVVAGILDGEEAIMGFANEAVITIASVLVLSGALARTGVARFIGQRVLAASGSGVGRLTAVMMATVGLLSGIMNDIGITALMLPVVLDMARRIGTPPSKLLMPLAFGSLLGGMTTLIGTAPNILVNGALRDAGLEPFGMFSFTPVGLTALAAGIVYMTFLGRRLFPDRDPKKESAPADLGGLYGLGGLVGMLRAPRHSTLAGKTLQQSRLGQALGLNVVAVQRSGQTILAPGPDFVLGGGDEMVVEGTLERFEGLRAWKHLEIESRDRALERIADASIEVAELELAEDSPLIGQTVRKANLRQTLGLHVLAILRGDRVHRTGLRLMTLAAGDRLVVAMKRGRFAALEEDRTFGAIHSVSAGELISHYQMERRIQSVRISEESLLAGQLLAETRLADAFGLTVVGILRADEELLMPDPDTKLEGGDVLLLRGRLEELRILQALQELTVGDNRPLDVSRLESDTVGLAEASLSPRTTFAGRTIEELDFRENYGVSILAIWRNGEIYRSGLRQMKLLPGDAFLLYGDRNKLARLVENPDFLVMTEEAAEVVRSRKGSSQRPDHGRRPDFGGLGPSAHLCRGADRSGPDGADRLPQHGRGLSVHRVESGDPDRGDAQPGTGDAGIRNCCAGGRGGVGVHCELWSSGRGGGTLPDHRPFSSGNADGGRGGTHVAHRAQHGRQRRVLAPGSDDDGGDSELLRLHEPGGTSGQSAGDGLRRIPVRRFHKGGIPVVPPGNGGGPDRASAGMAAGAGRVRRETPAMTSCSAQR